MKYKEITFLQMFFDAKKEFFEISMFGTTEVVFVTH